MKERSITQQLNRTLMTICAIILALMAVFANWQVIGRYLLSSPPGWTDEVLRFMLIWLTMIGAPLAHGMNRSMLVTFFVDRMSERNKLKNSIFVECLVILFAIVVLIIGGLIYSKIGWNVISASIGIRMTWVYMSLPVSGVLFVIYSFSKIKLSIAKLKDMSGGM